MQLNCGNIKEVSKHILKLTLNKNQEVVVDDVIEINKALETFTKEKEYALIANVSQSAGRGGHEVREYAAKQQLKGIMAIALIVKSLPLKLVANFYINFNKPKIATKLFTSEKAAIKWINTKCNFN